MITGSLMSTPVPKVDKLINYQFDNGVKFSGTAEQLLEYAKLVGESITPARLGGVVPEGYYLSNKKGLIKISEMETPHIVYALSKRTLDYYERIKPKTKNFNLREYLINYVALTESPEIEEMFMELSNRVG